MTHNNHQKGYIYPDHWAVYVKDRGYIIEWNRSQGPVFHQNKKFCYTGKPYASRLKNKAIKEFGKNNVELVQAENEN